MRKAGAGKSEFDIQHQGQQKSIALYEFFFFTGNIKKRIACLVPFGLTLFIIPLALTGMAGAGGITDAASKVSGAAGGISRLDYLFTQFRVIVTYIRLLFLPVDQAFDYDYPIFHSLIEPEVFLSFLLLLSVLIGGWHLLRFSLRSEVRNVHLYRLCSFGIFLFFIALSAESSIFPIADVIFEHRVYLPSVGFFIAMTSAIELSVARARGRTVYVKRILVLAMIPLIVVFSGATYSRNMVWNDRIGLVEDDIRKNPNKARPHNILGGLYAEQNRIEEAVRHLKTAITLNPVSADAHYSLGLTYANMGLTEEAVKEYTAAIQCKFDYVEARLNLAVLYAKLGHMGEALNQYRVALMINPANIKARNNLGNLYTKMGRIEEALQEYRMALQYKPDFVEAHYNLGNRLEKLGRTEEAIDHYATALKIRPDFAEARRKLEMYSAGIGGTDSTKRK